LEEYGEVVKMSNTECKECGNPLVAGSVNGLCPICMEEKLKRIRAKMTAKKQAESSGGRAPQEPKTVEKIIEITPTGDAIEQPRQIFGSSTKQFDLFDPQTKEKITLEATESGEEWMALCPKHDDTNPSLSINPKKGLYYCHGCEFKGSLWDESKKHIPKDDEPDKDDKDGAKDQDPTGEILATYDYCSANGTLLFQTVKLGAPPPKNKTFRQRRPNGNGGWIWNLKGTPLVPYRLPELLIGQDPVFICEGEKDVDNVRLLGLTATTNPMGAGKWKDIYNPCLAGRDVVILPDNDEAGRKHSNEVALSLFKTVKSIKILNLPNLPEKGDVSDWLITEKEGRREKLLHMVEATPSFDPKILGEKKIPTSKEDIDKFWEDLPTFMEVDENATDTWILDEIIPYNAITCLFGSGGLGKSHVAYSISRSIKSGTDWFGHKVMKSEVLYIDYEMTENRRGHIKKVCGDSQVKVWATVSPDKTRPAPPQIDDDDFEILKRFPPCFIVVDTLRAATRSNIQDDTDAAVMMSKLKELCAVGHTVVILLHTMKLNDRRFKGNQVIMDLSDHCLALFKVKKKGDTEEDVSEVDDPNEPKLLFFGTLPDDKSRYPKQKTYLMFDPADEKGAVSVAKDPIEEVLEKILQGLRDYLKNKEMPADPEDYFPMQKEFVEVIDGLLDCGAKKARKYIKQGVLRGYWTERESLDKKGKPVHYHPKH
jgi:uncharacterized Zn finger protein (UPF0148 family)